MGDWVRERELTLTPEQELRLRADGPCIVEGWDEDRAHVQALGSVQERETAHWELYGPGTVRVPRWARVRVEAFNGPARVHGLTQGRVHIVHMSGPLKVQNVAHLTGERFSGPLKIQNVTEEIALEDVRGPVRIDQAPRVLQARVRGPVRVHLPEPAGRRVILRVHGRVVLQVPEDTHLHGRVQTPSNLQVDLKHARTQTQGPRGLATWAADSPEQALYVDIETYGTRSGVYIGPNPPETRADWVDITDLGVAFARLMQWLAHKWGSRGRAPARRAASGLTATRTQPDQAKLQVLQMVAEGRLTAEQAAQLLEALEDHSRT